MAVTKLWSVTERLGQVIDYATNPEKTSAKIKREFSPEQYQALADVIAYAKDEEKTEREFYVESIVGNCDEFLYLGGNEQSTHKYVSELLGKETIDTNTFGKSTGRSGNYSTNYQISGRELLTPDEVRMLDNQYAILFIRGERPIMDFKYDIMKHPNVALTTDGKASPYKHGEVTKDIASIAIWDIDPATLPEKEMEETNWELLSDEEMEALFINNHVDQLDTQNAQVFFVDAMGVEYLSFIQQKCSEYGLSAKSR